jgi:hypothetical protein
MNDRATFTRMEESTQDDWRRIGGEFAGFARTLPDRLLAHLKVLEGGRGVLDRLVGLQSELAVRETYDGMTGYTDALDQYAALGFEITGIFPVARETDGLRVMEFDCVLIREGAAGQGK